ncbi:hypothetical protein HYPSUDRAFT_68742 [Hypholoma sublateritium FD-334 SS-4]|uniref:Uncharacterized protein n=1 Tax=Hypholoma sublateritium (strain FD-334 SS-4) TaxID=945553 RepID=A0A0D2MA01_HYPSF|nr:hypothetical protein HYPSUDRAFT_68742 [Hypholoma sublateritium FD-334 SS-4]
MSTPLDSKIPGLMVFSATLHFPLTMKVSPGMTALSSSTRPYPMEKVTNSNKASETRARLNHSEFQGNSCTSTGDMVADIPAQKTPASGCPRKRPNTCPGQKGLHPNHNFMDYSDDDCLHTFIKGQT